MSDKGKTDQQFQLIDTDAALKETVPVLKRQKILGVDLEADSMFHFTEKVCLIQIAAGRRFFLIDPLSVNDLSPLQPVFADPGVKKVFHGADYDIRSLHRDFGVTVENLFDTEVACRFLGFAETGLGSVVQRLYGVTLEKKYQKHDWSQRPLPSEMMAYATGDVLYLEEIYRHLAKLLKDKGRVAWVEEEFRLMCAARCAAGNGQPLFKKVKGAGRLDRRGLAVLEKLLGLRLEIARRKDRPPFKVMSNAALLQIAESKPKTREKLVSTGALSRKQVVMYATQVNQAVAGALEISEKQLPVYPREKKQTHPPEVFERINALKKWREETAAMLAVDSGVLFPNYLLNTVAQARPEKIQDLDGIEGLKNWQKNEFGEAIVRRLNKVPEAAKR